MTTSAVSVARLARRLGLDAAGLPEPGRKVEGIVEMMIATLAHCSSDTALRDIRELQARGILKKNAAGGRSTSYHLASDE